MIVIGLVCDPLDFCLALRKARQSFTVNKTNGANNIICTSFIEFRKLNLGNIKKRIFIFDALEKLKMIQNIVLIKQKSPDDCVSKSLQESTHVKISVKHHDYITETINKNNDSSISFLHEYNTNLYNITSVALREAVRGLYFDYLHGRISEENFDRELNPLYPKRGKSIEAFDNLKKLITSKLFKQAQKAISASQGKHDREIDKIAKDHGIAAFDLRYFLYTKK